MASALPQQRRIGTQRVHVVGRERKRTLDLPLGFREPALLEKLRRLRDEASDLRVRRR